MTTDAPREAKAVSVMAMVFKFNRRLKPQKVQLQSDCPRPNASFTIGIRKGA